MKGGGSLGQRKIEIEGDTTKLETALKSVNSEIKNTGSKLKDVNKLLKMDPGNTQLLSQKYKTLQQEIGTTWELAGIFADDGISGTGTRKRSGFMEMIAACEAKKVDLVITKSISRFARNTSDCLNYSRKLKTKLFVIIRPGRVEPYCLYTETRSSSPFSSVPISRLFFLCRSTTRLFHSASMALETWVSPSRLR